MEIKDCFTGVGDLNFDPFRSSEDCPKCKVLFKDGMINWENNTIQIIKKLVECNNWSPWCEAVGLIHADQIAGETKGNYSTIYYFR